MSNRPRLRQLLSFKAPKGPGFGINRGYYLSVLASKAQLPMILDVVSPKGENGSVLGFGVPLGSAASKDELALPIQRGAYAIASPDQKTVIKMLVLSKEEAGYRPDAFLASAEALDLDPETSQRMQATWTLLQLTFESFDPQVIPAAKFFLAVAERLAVLTEGVVADPISQAYRLPGQVLTPTVQANEIHPADLITVKARISQGSLCFFTLGWQKFDRPEIEMCDVEEGQCQVAIAFLHSVNRNILAGTLLEVGDTVAADSAMFKAAPGGLDQAVWKGVNCLELIPEAGTVSEGLNRWASRHYASQYNPIR